MTDWQPEQRFREALTKLDLGQADVIIMSATREN